MEALFLIVWYIIWGNITLVSVFLFVNIFYRSKWYQWAISDHFDGKRFFNIGWTPHESFRLEKNGDKKWGFLYWILHRNKKPWKNRNITQVIPTEKNTDWAKITYIGHATVLIQVGGKNIITDPVFSDRASPFTWLGPKRFTKPWIEIDNLPPIDIVLLSHNHYDHMDISSLRKIEERDSPKIYTGLWNKEYLEKRGIKNIMEMDWFDELYDGNADESKITFLPAQHFSARGLTDRNKTLWWWFRLEIENTSIYFAGDTGYGPCFDTIAERYKEWFDIGLIPIGAYKPRWFMAPIHTDPFEGMQIQRKLLIKKAIAIHYGTFDLADDNQDDPIEDLKKAKKDPKYKDQIFELGPSGTIWNW
jgi:L-ascorbate metabolism protein UlaG (beta-lactamase superfamily)